MPPAKSVSKFARYLPVVDDTGSISGERLRARHSDLSDADAEYLAWMYKLYRGVDLVGKKVYTIFEHLSMAVREKNLQAAIEKWVKLKPALLSARLLVAGMHIDATVNRPWSKETVSAAGAGAGAGASYPTNTAVACFGDFIMRLRARWGDDDCVAEAKLFENLRAVYCACVNFIVGVKETCVVYPSKIEAMEFNLRRCLQSVENMITAHNLMDAGTGHRVMLGQPAVPHDEGWKARVRCKGCVFCARFVRVAAVPAVAAAPSVGARGGAIEGAGLVEVEWEDVQPSPPKRSKLDLLIAAVAAGSNPPNSALEALMERKVGYAVSALVAFGGGGGGGEGAGSDAGMPMAD